MEENGLTGLTESVGTEVWFNSKLFQLYISKKTHGELAISAVRLRKPTGSTPAGPVEKA